MWRIESGSYNNVTRMYIAQPSMHSRLDFHRASPLQNAIHLHICPHFYFYISLPSTLYLYICPRPVFEYLYICPRVE